MKYHTWITRGSPTPSEKLLICDKCKEGYWYPHSDRLNYCVTHSVRLREATKLEYLEAKKKKVLKII